MRYTLWSRGQLIGHSALDHPRVAPRHRAGDLFPAHSGFDALAGVAELTSTDGSLELRDETGRTIGVEWISVRDPALSRLIVGEEEIDFWAAPARPGPDVPDDANPAYAVEVRLRSDEDVL